MCAYKNNQWYIHNINTIHNTADHTIHNSYHIHNGYNITIHNISYHYSQ